MTALIVYDSMFGNTERLARAIAAALSTDKPAAIVSANAASARDLEGIDLLVVGGPTQGHGLSQTMKSFLDGLPAETVRGLPAATFDTRLSWPRFLSGSAATLSARRLERKGARLVVPPESFLVSGREGPLLEGELDRATIWARAMRGAASRVASEPAGATS